MTFHRKPNAKGGNGRVRVGKYMTVFPDGVTTDWRVVHNDKQGYYVEINYEYYVATVDADGVWHATEKRSSGHDRRHTG